MKKFQLNKVTSSLKSWQAASRTLRKTGKINFIKIRNYMEENKENIDPSMKAKVAKLIGEILTYNYF